MAGERAKLHVRSQLLPGAGTTAPAPPRSSGVRTSQSPGPGAPVPERPRTTAVLLQVVVSQRWPIVKTHQTKN